MTAARKSVRRPGRKADTQRLQSMVRVDHAGEYGAVRIYQGQRAIFKGRPDKARIASQLAHMEADEQHHLDAFDTHIRNGLAKPTLLAPFWNLAGFALGAGTALLGEKAAHACTEAVEDTIEGHYNSQIDELTLAGETELCAQFTQFRDEEIAHKDLAVEEGAKDALGYPVLSALIKTGCHVAIEVSKRV